MISLVLPYWDRQAAAEVSLRALADEYRGLDLEVVVVDDGTPEPFRTPQGLSLDLRVVRLPEKRGPKNPCVPINRGVAASRGEYVALSGVEMIHDFPILEEMRAVIEAGGSKTYVTAAARAEDGNWHAHSSLLPLVPEGVRLPLRAHYHFMTMLSRDLWLAAGGFDEDYRDGCGYDDADFLLRVARAGASFLMRDDLVVRHRRSGARSAWWPAGFERNRGIFMRKWGR